MKRTALKRKTPLRAKRPVLQKSEIKRVLADRAKAGEALLREIHHRGLTPDLEQRVATHVDAFSDRPKRRYRKVGPERKQSEALWELARRTALLRDGFRCRKCGSRQLTRGTENGRATNLQVHHIRSQGAHPALKYELDNLITLCVKCHLFSPDAMHSTDASQGQTWLREHLGEQHLERLSWLAMTRKGSKLDKEATRLYLEAELAKMTGVS